MEICTVGGYEEVGKNMTAIKVGDDVFLFDAGLYLPPVIELQADDNFQEYTEKNLREVGALPDDLTLDKLGWRDKVRAIFLSHAHLDHVAALPYLIHRYPNVPILATPFTMGVVDYLFEDAKVELKNKKILMQPNSSYKIKGRSGEYTVEFVHATHSTLQCAFIALHTKEGVVFYALDFKLDKHPVMGEPANYSRFKELSKKGVKVLIVDALYSGTDRRCPSERIARDLVEDALSTVRDKNSALFITTFSSHIARLKSIVEFGKLTKRKIFFIGRSLNKYVTCAQQIKMCPFSRDIQLIKYKNQVDGLLKKVEHNRGDYMIVCTGHQAEPGSILDRIVSDKTPFKFKAGDNIIFSSSVIPVPININARDMMDKKLRKKGVRIQADVHVSGHGSREDLRDLVDLLKPKIIIPAHGSLQQETTMVELAGELGYKFHETVFLSANGKLLKL